MSLPKRPFKSIKDLYEEQLEIFRTMFHRELAVAAALSYCDEHKLNAPPWLVREASELLCSLLKGEKSKKRGRAAGAVARYRQDMFDYARWDQLTVVRQKQIELREHVAELKVQPNTPKDYLADREKMLDWVGHTLHRAFECASMLLQNVNAHGGPDAVKQSCGRVQRNSGDGSLRYHVLNPRFLRKVGIEHELGPRKGTKSVPLYDLTLEGDVCHRS